MSEEKKTDTVQMILVRKEEIEDRPAVLGIPVICCIENGECHVWPHPHNDLIAQENKVLEEIIAACNELLQVEEEYGDANSVIINQALNKAQLAMKRLALLSAGKGTGGS